MNISQTDICNAALQLIGAKEISNLDDASDRSPEARQCRLFYPIFRQTVFASHPWN